MHFFTILVLIIAVVFVFITVQNPATIDLTFMKWQFSEPLAIILASFFGVGVLAGVFLMIPTWWKRVKQSKTHKRRVHELEEEIANASQQVEQEEPVDAAKEPEKTEEEKKTDF